MKIKTMGTRQSIRINKIKIEFLKIPFQRFLGHIIIDHLVSRANAGIYGVLVLHGKMSKHASPFALQLPNIQGILTDIIDQNEFPLSNTVG